MSELLSKLYENETNTDISWYQIYWRMKRERKKAKSNRATPKSERESVTGTQLLAEPSSRRHCIQ